ncbi:MAG: class I SAM-dependent methyltransferase, partial [Actinomycetota bacterium]|nr:class I SAM-dependent methyltransferase [Actinomycetota bacterium]
VIARALAGRAGCVDAVELCPDEAAKVAALSLPGVRVVADDVFAWYLRRQPHGAYDAVVGNPPFVRYQTFKGDLRHNAFEAMAAAGLRPSRLTNAWVPFVVVAVRAVRPGGRVALVLPAELMQVGYAAELRNWLAHELGSLRLVTFRRLVFGPVQQETVLLLGERRASGTGGMASATVVAVDGSEDLDRLAVDGVSGVPRAALPPSRHKWTRLWLDGRQRALLDDIERAGVFPRLGDLASVDVGVVTGANRFFVMRPSEARTRAVRPWCLRLVGRSAQLQGLVLAEDDWNGLSEADESCLLLQLGPVAREDLATAALAYVATGEGQGFHAGYKCRIREPRWWHVPSVWTPEGFLLRQIHSAPRIIANAARATCTDTIHRVRITRPDVDPAGLAAASVNSLTWAFSEVEGRSYGGGVLELEPTEAEALPFPVPPSDLPVEDLDRLARSGGLERVADVVDQLTLRPRGLTRRDIDDLRGIWRTLSLRRTSRRRRGKLEA